MQKNTRRTTIHSNKNNSTTATSKSPPLRIHTQKHLQLHLLQFTPIKHTKTKRITGEK